MTIKRVIGVLPGLPPVLNRHAARDTVPPVALLHILSAVERKWPEKEVLLLDGNVTPHDKIIEDVKKFSDKETLLLVSSLTLNHRNGLRIVQAGRENGATVLMGNDHATLFSEPIMRDRPGVDYLGVGECGVPTTLGLVDALEGRAELDGVPNLVYRMNGQIRKTSTMVHAPLQDACPDMSLIENPDAYVGNGRQMPGPQNGEAPKKSTGVNFSFGCNGNCYFCGILDRRKVAHISPSSAVKWMAELNGMGYERLHDVCDDIGSVDRAVLRELAERKEKAGLDNIHLLNYCRSDHLMDISFVNLLGKLGVDTLFVGIESGDPAILRNSSKPGRRRETGPHGIDGENVAGVTNALQAGLDVWLLFVLGLPGETAKSIEKSVKIAETLVETSQNTAGKIIAADANMLIPFPGTRAWGSIKAKMGKADFFEKYENTDMPNVFELTRMHMDMFCQVSGEQIEKAQKEIEGMVKAQFR